MAKTTGIAQFATGESKMFKVDPCLLVLQEGWNTRADSPALLEHIDMLAQSIAEVGVRKPIEVKLEDGKLMVKDGFCRTRATMRAIEHYKAEIVAVPVMSVDRYANDADLILNQVISNSGKPLEPIEQATVFKKLLDMGWNQSNISKKTGLSNGRVSQLLDLLTMPASVQAAVAAGTVSASLAQSVVKNSETPQQAAQDLQAAADKAAAEGRKKVKPADTNVATVSATKSKTFKDCFDNSDIDNSEEEETGYVLIKMPSDDWEVIRQALKL